MAASAVSLSSRVIPVSSPYSLVRRRWGHVAGARQRGVAPPAPPALEDDHRLPARPGRRGSCPPRRAPPSLPAPPAPGRSPGGRAACRPGRGRRPRRVDAVALVVEERSHARSASTITAPPAPPEPPSGRPRGRPRSLWKAATPAPPSPARIRTLASSTNTALPGPRASVLGDDAHLAAPPALAVGDESARRGEQGVVAALADVVPGWMRVPRWRTRMAPDLTRWPSKTLGRAAWRPTRDRSWWNRHPSSSTSGLLLLLVGGGPRRPGPAPWRPCRLPCPRGRLASSFRPVGTSSAAGVGVAPGPAWAPADCALPLGTSMRRTSRVV